MPLGGGGFLWERTPGTRIANQGPLVSAQANDETDNLLDGINAKASLSGTGVMTGRQALFADGTTLLHGATVGQVQSGIVGHSTAVAGTVDAIQVTMSPAITTWATNELIAWKSGGANTITAPTISKDGGSTTKIIKKGASAALAVGDLGASGYECFGRYNGTDLILLNPAGSVGGSITASGYTMNTDRILGRDTAGSGAIEELTLGAGLTVSGGAINVSAGAIDVQTFTSSGTWTKPATGTLAFIRACGNGGSGASRTTTGSSSGGGGGACAERWIALSSLGATETVTIPAAAAGVSGNTQGNDGGNVTFGTVLTGFGGGGGVSGVVGALYVGGGGAATYRAAVSTGTRGDGGQGAGATHAAAGSPTSGASGGGVTGGNAVSAPTDSYAFIGGGGGGAACSTGTVSSNGADSILGGDGGNGSAAAAATAGANGPAGGAGGGGGGTTGGGTSGAGGQGSVVVYVFP